VATEPLNVKPGATYKFVVRSAEEAVETIRAHLGENAKVLSVRQVGGQGIAGIFSKSRLEVVAQVPESNAPVQSVPGSSSSLGISAEVAAPLGVAKSPRSPEPPASEQMDTRVPVAPVARDALPKLPELLRRSGFSETLLARLQSTPAFAQALEKPLHQGLVQVGDELRRHAQARRARPLPARTAFLGPSGVGRTTALCKWLAREVFARQKSGRVMKAEFDRPNPAEGLAVFCEALGLSVEYYAPSESEEPVTLHGPEGEFLYADLPGLSLRNAAENSQISSFLEREKFAGRVLVLNAAYDVALLRRAYAVGSDLGATHVVFTHLDEFDHWGKLWDLVLDGGLTPLFLATGPSLTGDCEEDAVGALLRRTIPGG
jgi:flagellar biosynthesis protein FlhF